MTMPLVRCAVIGCEEIVDPTPGNLVVFPGGDVHPVCEKCFSEIASAAEREDQTPMRQQARAMLYTMARQQELKRSLDHPRNWFTKKYGILFPNCRYGWRRMLRLTPLGGTDAAFEQRRASKHCSIALWLFAVYTIVGWYGETLRLEMDTPNELIILDLGILCVLLGYGSWASLKLMRYTRRNAITRKQESEDLNMQEESIF